MKIGLVLSSQISKSETFLISLIEILHKHHELVIYTDKRMPFLAPAIKQETYISNKMMPFKFPIYLFRGLLYLSRFKELKKIGIPTKQLLVDLPIWTSQLDFLHFAFGNISFNREHYADVMGCKMSLSFRGSDINVYPVWHQLSYYSILEKSHKIHVNAKKIAELVLTHHAKAQDKIRIIHPGIRNYFGQRVAQPSIDTHIQIICIGRLHWVKGYELLFGALALFKEKQANFRCIIIGDGKEEEKMYFLRKFYNLEKHLIFVGSKSQYEIIELMEQSHVFVQASWAEGLSNSTLEAQCMGLPAIVTPVSGMDEIILHKETGFITSNHSAESILEGLIWYSQLTENEKNMISDKAQKRSIEHFSFEKLEQNWKLFFDV